MAAALKTITIPAISKHTATLIFVHGLGDSAEGIKPVCLALRQSPSLHHVKWIIPDAPIRPVTMNFGMAMPSWFDIKALGTFAQADQDEAGYEQSRQSISDLITAEIQGGTDPSRIVLGGFSQGGFMSLLTGLTSRTQKLAGLMVMSGGVPMVYRFKELVSPETTSTPIFWGHGSQDPVVPAVFGEQSKDFLIKELGYSLSKDDPKAGLTFNVYPNLAHSIAPEELDDAVKWLEAIIPQ
ncbi:Phospholipase/carboxylesterase/thioesterase [Mycena floridula]|nr:Phospholipase/carboxylesterase/thioesterase [Mycena floridula]